MLKIILILNLLFLCSCSSPSSEGFREEGRSVNKSIIKKLQLINSREELISNSTELENLFIRLVDVMIEARKYQENTSLNEEIPLQKKDHLLSDKFRGELNRIYRIPGAKKIIEKAQQPALNRLDIFEQQYDKRKSKLPIHR